MNCIICQNNLPEFRLVNRSSFKQNESDYIYVCKNCLDEYSKLNPDALMLFPEKIVKISHYIKRDEDRNIFNELSVKIPWIYENVESSVYKFELYLGIQDPSDESLFCVILEDFNVFRENRNIMNTSYNNYENAPTYFGIFSNVDSEGVGEIVAIYRVREGTVQTLDPNQGLKFQDVDENNELPFSIEVSRDLLKSIIKKETSLMIFTDKDKMNSYFIFPKVIEKNVKNEKT